MENQIDIDSLVQRLGNDKDLLIEVVEVFLENYSSQLKRLETAVQAQDPDAVEDAAHSFKGALQCVGLNFAGSLAYQIEKFGRSENLSTVEEILLQLKENLKVALPELHSAITELR